MSTRSILHTIICIGIGALPLLVKSATAAEPELTPEPIPGLRVAFADEDEDRVEAKVRELLELTGASDMGMQTLDQMLEQFEGMPGLPDGFLEAFKELADPDELIELVVPIYMKHLEEKTLDASIEFAKSEAGQAFYAAQPDILQESMKAGAKWGEELAMEAMDRIGY